jgi:molybdopterin molybdotransferase
MVSVEEAREAILRTLRPQGVETVLFTEALGRVLAQDVRAVTPVPPFAQSAMDGFAVRAADTQQASPEHPVSLKILGTLGAGHLPAWTLSAGTAVRIMTGAPLPAGADAVIKREDTTFSAEAVTLFRPAHPQENIVPPGRDIPAGAELLRAGEVVTPAIIGLHAALGLTHLRVYRRPRVGILALGDELVPPEVQPAPGQIRVSNLYAIAASVTKYGGVAHNLGIAGDRLEAIYQALDGAGEVDLLITLGGSQRGDFDFVDDLLSGARGRMLFRDVAANYVRSMIFGFYGHIPLCGLPGGPIAAYVSFEAFVRGAIWKLGGRRVLEPPRLAATLTAPLPATRDRAHFQPVWLAARPEALVAIPLAVQKAADLPPQTLANGLIYRGPASPGCEPGAQVWVDMIEPPSPLSSAAVGGKRSG